MLIVKRLLLMVSLTPFLTLTACESVLELLDEECKFRNEQYQQILAVEGQLQDEVPTQAPYPMALVVSQNSLNKLLAELTEGQIDPVEFGIVKLIPNLPKIQIKDTENCDTCIVLEVSFGIEIDAILDTLTAQGTAIYQFPIRMETSTDRTQVFADFNQSEFQRLGLITGQAFIDEALAVVEDQITGYVNQELQDTFGAVELFSMDAWNLGSGAIKILASGPILSADTQTLMIGLHTNLVQPLSESVALDPTLPEGVDIGLQIHPEIIQVVLQRLLHEGVVARSYTSNGTRLEDQDDSSALNITLSSIKSASQREMALDFGFTLWRTQGGLCGSAELHTDFKLSVGDSGMSIDAGNLRVENTQGSFGWIAEQLEDWLAGDFIQEMTDLTSITLNYNELNIPNREQIQLDASDARLNIDGQGVNVYFNFSGLTQ